MFKSIYSIQDVKVCVFHAPMVLLNDAEARRVFCDITNDPQTPIFKHPKDFRLFKIGGFDDNSGVISPLGQPEFLTDAYPLHGKRLDQVTEDVLVDVPVVPRSV